MGKALDLLGQKFGKLTAIEKMDIRNKRGLIVWKCQCECGNITEVVGSSLKNGSTKSCGCSNAIKRYNLEQSEQAKILMGTVFGKLTVIEDLGFKKHVEGHNRRFYLCQCECGNTCEVSGNQLKTGHRVSCGCVFSKGEYLISNLLKENNITFNHDLIFPELLKETGKRLRFDFIIYNEDGSVNRFVEFDGNQHQYGMIGGIWPNTETLEVIKERDKIKNDFCLSHNYILIRIPYYKIKNLKIDDIMTDVYQIKEMIL